MSARVLVSVPVIALLSSPLFANNQTPTLSPILIGTPLPYSLSIQTPTTFNDALPTLQSFARSQHNGQWLLLGGISNGQHIGGQGFQPQFNNTEAIVIDPLSQQVWRRSLLTDPSSGLASTIVDALQTSNTQFSTIGSKLYITGGYGPNADKDNYLTYDTLTSVDIPSLMNWVKTGSGTAAAAIRQIQDPIFRVTGGEMGTTSNGLTHLIFGQDYPEAYQGRLDGIYTRQVRTFRIVDDAGGLSFTDAVYHPLNPDFRRRDLNVVPIIRKENGQLVDKFQALSGVFTGSFGAWTVPVTVDAAGLATQPDPTLASTFKQGMNGYRCATIGLYSKSTDTMHSLLLGGISYQYLDQLTGQILNDPQLPYIHEITDIITDANGNMSQHLLPTTFPVVTDALGRPLFLGTETEFFLREGIPTFSNGVIDLDALSGAALIGYLFGGIGSTQPNNGTTYALNELFPVYLTPTPVPEPTTLPLLATALWLLKPNRRRVVCSNIDVCNA